MIDDMSMTWFGLRARRATLRRDSLLSESASRRQTFATAMSQFEEQFAAAKIVTPATRPLNLYYGLAQAGVAIAAARAPGRWSASRHGLKLVDAEPELGDIEVRAEGDGTFQRLIAATGSPGITAPVSLGALWASLPDLCPVGPLPGSVRPAALDMAYDGFSQGFPHARVYLPYDLLPETSPEWLMHFRSVMDAYPAVKDWGIPAGSGSVAGPESDKHRWVVTLTCPAPDPAGTWTGEQQETFFDGIAPEYRYNGDRFLRPSVEGGQAMPPSPLMTWWILLYGFSILARYQPRKWFDLLDPDRSEAAAPLQFALETALSAVPHLVLEALDGEKLLFRKPLSL